jgi:hypothetical protein
MSNLARLLPLAVAGALTLGEAAPASAAPPAEGGWRDAAVQLVDGRGRGRGHGYGWGPPPPRWRGPPPGAYYAPPPRYYYPPPVVYYPPPPPPPRYYYYPPPPPPGIGLYFRF